jgi:hypothetical protein
LCGSLTESEFIAQQNSDPFRAKRGKRLAQEPTGSSTAAPDCDSVKSMAPPQYLKLQVMAQARVDE